MAEVETVLVTGCAGFIGMHLTKGLLKSGFRVVGLDNLNDYYDPGLKRDRLDQLGVNVSAVAESDLFWAGSGRKFGFVLGDIRNEELLTSILRDHSINTVFHLAAQAGVRYSIEKPYEYVSNNITGTTALLQACRNVPVKHLFLASSSSVYGAITKVPFREDMNCNSPMSVYAASKSSAELIAHTYSKLFNMNITALRFFTVYGSWDRPDMALHRFVKRILAGEPIEVYNHGKMERDFTYVADLVSALLKLVHLHSQMNPKGFSILNVGSGNPVSLGTFVNHIEKALGRTAEKQLLPMQAGDLLRTYADTSKLSAIIGEMPRTELSEGIGAAVSWHLNYYHGEELPSTLRSTN